MSKKKQTANPGLNHKQLLERLLRLVLPMVVLAIIIFTGSRVTKTGGILADTENEYVQAQVTSVIESHVYGDPPTGFQQVEAVVTSGQYQGQTCTVINNIDYQHNTYVTEGSKVVVIVRMGDDSALKGIQVENYDRSGMVYVLLGLFALITILVGGKKGAAALYALAFTFVCVICMYIPLIYVGWNGILAAVATSLVILSASIYIINGWSKKTVCAIIGTTVGVTISGVLAMIIGGSFHLSGYQMEEAQAMINVAHRTGMQVGHILYAGILISSLGAVMDVSVSIVAAMDELRQQSPGLTGKAFFLSGLRVGKDMIGTMSNTLILAYTGSATGTILYMYAGNMSFNRILSKNAIVIEILCGLCGTIGVIVTVPIQALITTVLYQRKPKQGK